MATSDEARRSPADPAPNTEPAPSSHPADPTDRFLERKARRRAEAAQQEQIPQKAMDHRRFFRADTSSAAFRPWNLWRGK